MHAGEKEVGGVRFRGHLNCSLEVPRDPVGVLLLLLFSLFCFIFVVLFIFCCLFFFKASKYLSGLIGEEEVEAVWDSTHKGGFAGQANMGIGMSILGLKSHFNSLKSPINCKA